MTPAMETLNAYGRQLSQEEIDRNMHRDFVGGMWDAIGTLQFDFLRQQGLCPHHRLLDVGCGALRGGIHYARYLDDGHYYGMDINASLIEAGHRELKDARLDGKHAHLLVNPAFEFGRFDACFDMAIAVSVLTHLPANHIVRCLVEISRVLAPGGRFFATFFQAPVPAHITPLRHTPGGKVSHYDSDPYHYAIEEVEWMARLADMKVDLIGDWNHPRDQKMLCFSAA